MRQHVKPEYSRLDQMDKHDPWNATERKHTVCDAYMVLYCANVSLNLWNILICSTAIQTWEICSSRLKLRFGHDGCDVETTVFIKLDNCLELLDDGCCLTVWECFPGTRKSRLCEVVMRNGILLTNIMSISRVMEWWRKSKSCGTGSTPALT